MYDHSKKIGNKGDLIKHFALTVATRELASGKASFSYLDVHSGRSCYDLPYSGEWQSGIGKFAAHCGNKHSLNEHLRYFCEIQSVTDVSKTRKYPGSSRIILNVLQDLGVAQIEPILCDTNPIVCKDNEVQFHDLPSVEIHCGNGYQKAHEVEVMGLIIIDPPDLEDHYRPFLKLVRHCVSKGKPFISWNPLHGNVPQQTMSRNCLAVANFSKEQRIPSITVRWTKEWSDQMCGCQMLFFVPYGDKVAVSCDALIHLMGWKRILD